MIYKNVKNVSNNLKDGGSLLQRIVVVDNSPINNNNNHVALPLLQSDKWLNSSKHKAI